MKGVGCWVLEDGRKRTEDGGWRMEVLEFSFTQTFKDSTTRLLNHKTTQPFTILSLHRNFIYKNIGRFACADM